MPDQPTTQQPAGEVDVQSTWTIQIEDRRFTTTQAILLGLALVVPFWAAVVTLIVKAVS